MTQDKPAPNTSESDKLSDEDFNRIREFYSEDTKYYFPNRLIAEIDRLRAETASLREAAERQRSENAELREIVRECREYLVTVEHRGSPFKNEDEYPEAKRYCTDYEDCDACVIADTLARIVKACSVEQAEEPIVAPKTDDSEQIQFPLRVETIAIKTEEG